MSSAAQRAYDNMVARVTAGRTGCHRWMSSERRWCNRTDGLKQYQVGPLCPEHQPRKAIEQEEEGAHTWVIPLDPDWLCCGQHAIARKGRPRVLACQLCPKSPTYWRTNETTGGTGGEQEGRSS